MPNYRRKQNAREKATKAKPRASGGVVNYVRSRPGLAVRGSRRARFRPGTTPQQGLKAEIRENVRTLVPKLTQNLRNMRVGNPLSRKLAGFIANPAAAEYGFQLNDSDSNYTATANLPKYFEYNNQVALGTTSLGSTTKSQHFMFRDVARATVSFQVNPGTAASPSLYCYQGLFYVSGEVATVSMTEDYMKHPINFTRFKSLALAAAMPNSLGGVVGWQPHGQYLYPGITGAGTAKRSYIYLDKSATISVTLSGSITSALIQVKKFLSPGTDDPTMANLVWSGTGTHTYVAAGEGYYCLEASEYNAADAALIASVYIYGAGDCFCHHPVPGFDDALAVYAKCRINALSTLIHPTAATLYTGGTIAGNYLENCFTPIWTDIIGTSPDTNMHYKRVLPFETGLYTFLPMDFSTDLFMQHAVTLDSAGALMEANFQLDSESGYISMLLVCPNNGNQNNSVGPSLEYLMTHSYCIEYTTRDLTRSTRPVTVTHNVTNDALDIVRTMRVFYENPLHIRDIRNYISSGYGKAKQFLGAASGAVSVAQQIAAALAPFMSML